MQKIIILLVAMVLTIPTYAQNKKKENKEEWKKELQDFKYKYLAQEIELTEEQMTNFFELYAKLATSLNILFLDLRTSVSIPLIGVLPYIFTFVNILT